MYHLHIIYNYYTEIRKGSILHTVARPRMIFAWRYRDMNCYIGLNHNFKLWEEKYHQCHLLQIWQQCINNAQLAILSSEHLVFGSHIWPMPTQASSAQRMRNRISDIVIPGESQMPWRFPTVGAVHFVPELFRGANLGRVNLRWTSAEALHLEGFRFHIVF